MAKTLADIMPAEFTRGEFRDTRAYAMRDIEVADTHRGRWPGPHKNVNVWVSLVNGYAVGWNENPSTGWSFPVMKLPANRQFQSSRLSVTALHELDGSLLSMQAMLRLLANEFPDDREALHKVADQLFKPRLALQALRAGR